MGITKGYLVGITRAKLPALDQGASKQHIAKDQSYSKGYDFGLQELY